MVALTSGTIQIRYCSHLLQRFHAIQNELQFLDQETGVADFVNRLLRSEFSEAGELRILVGNLMADAETPTELLSLIVEAVSQPEIPPDVTEVRIMSLHKSKGPSSPIVGIAGGGEEGREPVQAGEDAVLHRVRRNLAGPAQDAGHAEAAFHDGPFALRERRVAAIGPGEGLGAVVGGEDDDGVVVHAHVLELLHHAADDVVELGHAGFLLPTSHSPSCASSRTSRRDG